MKLLFILLCMAVAGTLSFFQIPRGLTNLYPKIGMLLTGKPPTQQEIPNFNDPFAVAAAVVFGVIASGLFAVFLISYIERGLARWKEMQDAERITFLFAVLVGAAISIPFHMLFFTFGKWAITLSIFLMLGLIWLSFAVLRGVQEAFPWARGAPRRKSNLKIFDTSVIIDGRIYEVAKAGFLEGKIYVPEFVIKELHNIADSHEPNRRQRGRRGIDLLKNLQADFEIEIGTHDKLAGDPNDPVDTRLVRLAKALGASLVTNDFNLNKIAQVHGVPVLNVNDLALAMRPHYLPGDVITVQLEREGTQPNQGVGFMDDGTMVVVDEGLSYIGKRIPVKITQVHQSTAGRMIFGVPETEAIEETKTKRARA
ncbi:MAG TPA: PIN domain-containing protein [Fimbriimonadales bacterium]|nr:PIN domain-containing protein [Fimbriimonadales bacterium]